MAEFREKTASWCKNNKIFFVVALLSLIPFIATWARGRLLYDFDMTFITAPIEDMFARYERAWQLPLWAPELQFGYPLIAISHLGFFYPLHLVLRFFLPGVITLNISLAFHILLAALGTYLFLKQEKFSKGAAAFGALLFVGTGFFVGRLYLTNVILPFAWIPINLWFLAVWLQKKSYRSLFTLGVGVALQVLLGQPQAALIGAVVLSLYAVAHLFTDFKKTIWRVPPIILPAILSVLLCLAQLQPTLSIVEYSDRADAMLPKELYEFNLPFSHLVSWVFPHAFGYHENYIGAKNETELSSWLGVTVLVILVLGIFSGWKNKKRALITFLLFLGGSLLMVIGESSPLYRYLVENHWMDSLSIPARWLVLMTLSFGILAAQGWEELSNFSNKKRKFITLGALILIFAFSFWSYKNISPNIRPAVKNNLLSEPIRTSIPFIAAALTSILIIKFPQKKNYLFGLVVLELLVPNLTRNVTVPFSQPFIKSQAEEFLEKDGGALFTQRDLQPNLPTKPVSNSKSLNRIKLSQEILSPHIAASKGYLSAQWLGALQLKEVKRFLYEVGDQNENADGHNPYLEDRREMFNRLGITHFLSSYAPGQDIGNLKNISLLKEWPTETQTVRLYKNLEAHPFAEFVTNVESVVSPDDARAVMLDKVKTADDPVPSEDDTLTQGKIFTAGKVSITKREPTEITLQTENDDEGFLILRQTFFPGWKATIDNKETRIFPSDWIFQGIIVPEGNHKIVVYYENKIAVTSVKISLATWIIVMSVFLFFSFRTHKK